MGLMRLTISPPDRITEEMAQQAYLCGLDRVPWKGRVRWGPGELSIQRAVSESGSLYIPWVVDGHPEHTPKDWEPSVLLWAMVALLFVVRLLFGGARR